MAKKDNLTAAAREVREYIENATEADALEMMESYGIAPASVTVCCFWFTDKEAAHTLGARYVRRGRHHGQYWLKHNAA